MTFFIWWCASSTTNTTLVKASLPILVVFMFYLLTLKSAEAQVDSFDPIGNVTIKWDIKIWTPDGYIAMVTIYNYYKFRHFEPPGWKLGWEWKKKEIIWEMFGAQATEQGDCSRFKSKLPHSCERHPKIVDLLPGTPYNQQVSNCCKGGVLSPFAQDPVNALSMFQIQVGQSGTSNKTVKLPENFTLSAPGPGHTCAPAMVVEPSKFLTPDKRRITRSFMTWNVVCTYSQTLAPGIPTCCVSLSSFYSKTIIDCPTCTCGCKKKPNSTRGLSDSPYLASSMLSSTVDKSSSTQTPLLHCTNHMCPIRIHWHVKQNYRHYWRVKITVTNFNYRMNYSQWNIVVRHPNLDNITQIFSFNYMSMPPHPLANDTGMFWGLKFYNDLLMQAGPDGNVQSELLFGKDKSKFSFEKGWAFPQKLYFNGDNCVMPPPDSYPFLPNACATHVISLVRLLLTTMLVLQILVFD